MLQLLQVCERCHLKDTRKNVVIPRGNCIADFMFLGEAPGKDEDEVGVPFVGRAGQWFESMIEQLGFTKEDFYLTNTVKCRPVTQGGKNRTPTIEEIQFCSYWLKQEIDLVNPKLIVIMGGTALKVFFENTKISNVAGEELLGHKLSKSRGIRLFVLYHPAVLVYNKSYYLPIYKRHLNKLNNIIDSIQLVGSDFDGVPF